MMAGGEKSMSEKPSSVCPSAAPVVKTAPESVTLGGVASGRNNNFNLIRVLAALSVMLSHSFMVADAAEPFYAKTHLTLGTMAVDVFFITSGFLVTASLINRRSLLAYFSARALRIFPALVVNVWLTVFLVGSFFTVLPLSAYFANPATWKYLLKDSIVVTGLVYNLPGVFTNTSDRTVNGPLWSISFELRCYVLLALVWAIWRGPKTGLSHLFKFSIATIAIVSLALRLTGHFAWASDDGYPQLFFMFFTGASFYLFREHVILSPVLFWVCAAALGLSTFNQNLFFVIYTFAAAYMVFYLAYMPGGAVRAYNRLGDYSYGIYIYGFIVQQGLRVLLPHLDWWQSMMIAVPVVLIPATLSWHLLEKRALRFKSGNSRREALLGQQSDAVKLL